MAEQLFDLLGWINRYMADHFTGASTASQQSGIPSEVYQSLAAGVTEVSQKWLDRQVRYGQQQSELWLALLARAGGEQRQPTIELGQGDRRFQGRPWTEEPLFDYLKQHYLLISQWMLETIEFSSLEEHSKKKLAFFARQFVDAMSPANFPATNPEAIKLAMESEGESVSRGMKNLVEDLKKGRITMTDETAFEVGKNLAVTPGSVVYENELIQLIQYVPRTAKVYERPLLIVPPFINKYYILDLQEEDSFVRFALERGHGVFMISWRNIPKELGSATWDDYIEQGVFKALEVAREITGSAKINTLGFCVGGTLLACALAVMRTKRSTSVASLTLLATMLDFSDTGDIGIYVDEAYVRKRESDMAEGGIVHGSELAYTFASLRANELIWHYVVNNYLKGKNPEPFDLLYWNSDGSNLPGRLYVYYLRNMYLENNLKIPSKLSMGGVPVDLGKINLPTFALAAKLDHIVPWKTAYVSARLLGKKVEFVLTESGHIAGVINPASKNRRSYWINEFDTDSPEVWLDHARTVPGSWWNRWAEWLAGKAGRMITAPERLGSDQHPPIEPAPGRYVRAKSEGR